MLVGLTFKQIENINRTNMLTPRTIQRNLIVTLTNPYFHVVCSTTKLLLKKPQPKYGYTKQIWNGVGGWSGQILLSRVLKNNPRNDYFVSLFNKQ